MFCIYLKIDGDLQVVGLDNDLKKYKMILGGAKSYREGPAVVESSAMSQAPSLTLCKHVLQHFSNESSSSYDCICTIYTRLILHN